MVSSHWQAEARHALFILRHLKHAAESGGREASIGCMSHSLIFLQRTTRCLGLISGNICSAMQYLPLFYILIGKYTKGQIHPRSMVRKEDSAATGLSKGALCHPEDMSCSGFSKCMLLLLDRYGCQIWATSTLSYESAAKTKAHIHHVCFLKSFFLH